MHQATDSTPGGNPALDNGLPFGSTAVPPHWTYRQRFRQIFIAVAFVVIAVTANWLLSEQVGNRGGLTGGLLLDYLFTQLTVATIWLVMYRGWFLIRLLPAVAIVESISWQFENRMLPMRVTVIFICLIAIGIFSLHAVRMITPPWKNGATRSPTNQFSLKQLLGLMTYCAILFALANWHSQQLQSGANLEFRRYGPICAIFAAMALLGVWAVLGSARRRLLRIMLPLMAALGAAVLVSQLGPRASYTEIVTVLLLQSLMVALMIIVWLGIEAIPNRNDFLNVASPNDRRSTSKPREQVPG